MTIKLEKRGKANMEDIRVAAEQLVNYLYPDGLWIGTHWIQDNVLIALSENLKLTIQIQKLKDTQPEK